MTFTVERPGCEVDSMLSMPGTLFTAASMICVTLLSITSGVAPVSTVAIDTTGCSIFG